MSQCFVISKFAHFFIFILGLSIRAATHFKNSYLLAKKSLSQANIYSLSAWTYTIHTFLPVNAALWRGVSPTLFGKLASAPACKMHQYTEHKFYSETYQCTHAWEHKTLIWSIPSVEPQQHPCVQSSRPDEEESSHD